MPSGRGSQRYQVQPKEFNLEQTRTSGNLFGAQTRREVNVGMEGCQNFNILYLISYNLF